MIYKSVSRLIIGGHWTKLVIPQSSRGNCGKWFVNYPIQFELLVLCCRAFLVCDKVSQSLLEYQLKLQRNDGNKNKFIRHPSRFEMCILYHALLLLSVFWTGFDRFDTIWSCFLWRALSLGLIDKITWLVVLYFRFEYLYQCELWYNFALNWIRNAITSITW